ncbi:unnamed protein product [Adineta steineri]|uniref:PPM-type phosphatase domain-containing protein n=1 Tax=Adineta steineri TaxID=433720 RepID=A0A815U3S3_9BILA|nr:unnamed protein product [Adineta steineri]CAF1514277.1 unnamed protein product [Adineta steineri]
MAASSAAAAAATPTNIRTTSSNLSNFIPCQHTFVATRTKQDPSSSNNENTVENSSQRATVPRVCRLRTNDNAMAIYALVDPIGTSMLASDVCVNMLVEQLSKVSFDDDTYKEKINDIMQNVSYEIENRLLQMTFDHAEEKITSAPSSVSAAEKLLPSLDEAESGAFLFATTVTQSYMYLAYVGTIRAFLISNNNGDLIIDEERPQYFHTGSLHTIDNEDECRRLKNLDVDVNQVKHEGFDKNHSKFTRCIGKLSEKLLSSAASANDVNEARCNPLICEPKVSKFKLLPTDYAFVLMTDKFYKMYLKTRIPENEIPSDFIRLFRESIKSPDPAEYILRTVEQSFQSENNSANDDSDMQDMGLIIHFFHQPKNATQSSTSLSVKPNHIRRVFNGEVTVDEVRKFINKNNEIQEKREKNRNSSTNYGHQREVQSHSNSIEPFVRFDVYEKLLKDNEELHQANDLITELLYTQSTSMIDEKLTEFLREHPSLKCD